MMSAMTNFNACDDECLEDDISDEGVSLSSC